MQTYFGEDSLEPSKVLSLLLGKILGFIEDNRMLDMIGLVQ